MPRPARIRKRASKLGGLGAISGPTRETRGATAAPGRPEQPGGSGAISGPPILKVADALLWGWGAPVEAALQDVTGDVAPAEAEGQRHGEDEAAEGDTEGDDHHLLADAQVRERGGDGEEQHAPVDAAGEQPRLGQARVDRRDE